jgi:hypothetical protein
MFFSETKVLAKLHAGQIESHRRTAERRGFKNVTAVAIVPRSYVSLPNDVVVLEWRMIYTWLREHGSVSTWAARHRQFGILVTTSYVALQAYQEIKEDGHPIVIISAQDIVNLIQKAGLADVLELRKWLSAF